ASVAVPTSIWISCTMPPQSRLAKFLALTRYGQLGGPMSGSARDTVESAGAQVASTDHPGVRPVHHGARLERDERLDFADRCGTGHDGHRGAERDHDVHARDGRVHARGREAR